MNQRYQNFKFTNVLSRKMIVYYPSVTTVRQFATLANFKIYQSGPYCHELAISIIHIPTLCGDSNCDKESNSSLFRMIQFVNLKLITQTFDQLMSLQCSCYCRSR
jgi:hypothetical protein